MIDTHAHIYLPEFDEDREAMVGRCLDAGLTRIYMPNIDERSVESLHGVADRWPDLCKPMMGLHPCSVGEDWRDVLTGIRARFDQREYAAVGEIGLDGYWDPESLPRQEDALRVQLAWGIELDLPVILHTRDAMDRCIAMVRQMSHPRLRGIFHCFNGTGTQARQIADLGFLLGIGGVYTYPKADMAHHLREIPLDCLVLETDAPYLAPVPYRGKRNEPAYLPAIVAKLASDRRLATEEVVSRTSANARRLFGS